MTKIKPLFILITLLLASIVGYGQKVMKGIVVDSASFISLPDVHVSIKNSHHGTFTDAKGNFMLVVEPNDTLQFTLVGFKAAEYSVAELRYESIVRLAEESILLNPVMVHGTIDIPVPEIEKKRIWQNNTYDPGKTTPGMVPTFGPGVSIPFSFFSKGESEKRKAEKLREENEQATTYTTVVSDPTVMQALMKKYNLSEKGYYDILTKFNERNSGFMYTLTAEELVKTLDNFFSNNAPK